LKYDKFRQAYSDVSRLADAAFFYGLKSGRNHRRIDPAITHHQVSAISEPTRWHAHAFFELNGQPVKSMCAIARQSLSWLIRSRSASGQVAAYRGVISESPCRRITP